MNTRTNPISEEHLKEVASRFHYPATPDVAEAVMNRLDSGSKSEARAERSRNIQLRSAWMVTGLLVLALVALFAVPSVRAEIIRFFQVGVVRIFPGSATETANPASPQIPSTATPLASPEITQTPRATRTPTSYQTEPLYSITASDLAGESSLEAARDSLPFPIRVPIYPPDLGSPGRVFLQENDQMVILVWSDPDNPDTAHLSLHEIGPGSVIIGKFKPRVIQETQVNGKYAVWVEGPYLVQLTNDTYNWRRLVPGNTLIWELGDITYRLESDLTLEETIQIAESLR